MKTNTTKNLVQRATRASARANKLNTRAAHLAALGALQRVRDAYATAGKPAAAHAAHEKSFAHYRCGVLVPFLA